jgi:putative SOS response-associated peptidase YedK
LAITFPQGEDPTHMCGRYTLRTPLSVLAGQFEFEFLDQPDFLAQHDLGPRYNIAPTQDVAAIRVVEPGGPRQLALLHWGLIPSWAKDTEIASGTINARGDTVATKPAFRAAFKRRRCLILADGYYEWLRSGKAKLPHLYEINGGQPFAMAGLWESWHGTIGPGESTADRVPLESCTIITTEANPLASQIHDRMPVILHPTDFAVWLDPANQDIAELARLITTYEGDDLSVRPVGTYVNNSRNQGDKCTAPPDS